MPLRPRIVVTHITVLAGSLAKEQNKQLSATGGPPDLSPAAGPAAVAMLARHRGAARELLLAPLSAEEFRIPVTETDLNVRVLATDVMFVPIHLEIQGPARPLAMWAPLPVMRIQPKLTSAHHLVPVDSQTIRIHLQGHPAALFLVPLVPLIVVLHVDRLANYFEPFLNTKMT